MISVLAFAQFKPADPSTIKYDPHDKSFIGGGPAANLGEQDYAAEKAAELYYAKLNHTLLPEYFKALKLQKERRTDELDDYLFDLYKGKVGAAPLKFTNVGQWVRKTLMEDLMDRGDMKRIWLAVGSPKTKSQMDRDYLGRAAAAAIGITYPGEYGDLRKELKWTLPDERAVLPFDKGDDPQGIEIMALFRLDSVNRFTPAVREADFGLYTLYDKILPGNDYLFVALWGCHSLSNPDQAIAAWHRHFPNGAPKEYSENNNVKELMRDLNWKIQQEKGVPSKSKYTGPLK